MLEAAILEAKPDVVAKLVLDLCNLSDDNRFFVETRLAVTEEPLLPYKDRIYNALCPDVYSNKPIRIAAARKAIAEYKRAIGRTEGEGLLELMIYYVECGTALTAEFGDINEAFYSSMESMYDRFLKGLEKVDPVVKESYRDRVCALVNRAGRVGWGFHDYLVQRLAEAYEDQDPSD